MKGRVVKIVLNRLTAGSDSSKGGVLVDKNQPVHSKFTYRMKNWKNTLTLFCCIFAFAANAQFQKGSVLLEGSAGASFDFKKQYDGADYKPPYQFHVGVKGGYFLNAKNEIGLGLGLGKSRNSYNFLLSSGGLGWYSQKSSSIASSFYWRHYTPIGGRLMFSYAVEGWTVFSELVDWGGAGFNTRNLTQIDIGISPSLVYMLNSKIGLRGNFGNLGFSFNKFKDDTQWSNSFSANFSPQALNFGLFMVLNNSKTDN